MLQIWLLIFFVWNKQLARLWPKSCEEEGVKIISLRLSLISAKPRYIQATCYRSETKVSYWYTHSLWICCHALLDQLRILWSTKEEGEVSIAEHICDRGKNNTDMSITWLAMKTFMIRIKILIKMILVLPSDQPLPAWFPINQPPCKTDSLQADREENLCLAG